MYNELLDRYGMNKTNWMWGEAHSMAHKHMLSKVTILDYLFSLNIGPFKSATRRGHLMLEDTHYKPYHQTSGASMRRIVDFQT